MDYSTLRRMEAGDYMDLIENTCDEAIKELGSDMDSAGFFLDEKSGHFSIHANKTNKELVIQMLQEKKSAAGTFSDEKTAKYFILTAIAYHSQAVERWFHDGYIGRYEGNYRRLILDVNLYEETGRNITQDYKEYTSKGIRIVLDRNNTGTAPLGFSVTTAYPSMKYSRPSGRQMDPKKVALADLGYKNPTDRIYAYTRGFKNTKVFITSENSVKATIFISETKRVDMYFKANSSSDIYILQPAKARKRLHAQEMEQYPEISKFYRDTKALLKQILNPDVNKRGTVRIIKRDPNR